jgi:uncharacterized protein (TIGR02284 family)
MIGLSIDAHLKALIEHCEDTARAMTNDAANADRMALQLLMTQRATCWHRWAAELSVLHLGVGVASRLPPSRAAAFKVSDVSDQALLAECERRESSALKLYRDALEEDVPAVVRAVLWRHVEGIQNSMAQMRSLKPEPQPTHD